MGKVKKINATFSELTLAGLKKAKKELIKKEKKNKGYLIVADKEGTVKKIPASKL